MNRGRCSTDDKPVNCLPELADVPGPRVRLERDNHVRAELDVPPIPTVQLLKKK